MQVGDHRATLARLFKDARLAKGLSVRKAAAAAGVDRATWSGVEDATRLPQDHTAARMEQAVDWGIGSFASILAGGSPLPPSEVDLDERGKEVVRATFEELRKEHGRKGALRIINDALADLRDSEPDDHLGRQRGDERGAG